MESPAVNQALAAAIKQEAASLGFDACGIAKVGRLSNMESGLRQWLSEGKHGAMGYMEKHLEKRLDPSLLVENAKSVIVVALNYYTDTSNDAFDNLIVSKYARDKDYHLVMKEKISKLEAKLKQLMPNHDGRIFVDSAPLLEKAWAVRAGLGWIGKNTCLIIPRKGSFFFLGELVTNIELPEDKEFASGHCGACTRCIDACPTAAIVAPGNLDARKCISYLTIELKAPIPDAYRDGSLKGQIFGCDICQDVCPHNRFAKPGWFNRECDFAQWSATKWSNLTKEEFKRQFVLAKSPIARVKFEKLQDNIAAANMPSEKA
ncbi:MAG TPA: tRNA epoxyqueuosine(34) reductase QueG [Bacteroidales bacterium]|nr:tRNA epoxyqueuosine(34) reductase QueG [Bacteroidales bacterium]